MPVSPADKHVHQHIVQPVTISPTASTCAIALAEAIPGARLLRIPDKDHLTVVPDQRFKDAVVQFLGEVAED